jgi:hypothetical protein
MRGGRRGLGMERESKGIIKGTIDNCLEPVIVTIQPPPSI